MRDDLAAWLSERRPRPPSDLAAALRPRETEGAPEAVLAEVARGRLELARSRPGRVRETAFRLLEADALFSYACEAALETGDPDRALRRILGAAAR